MLTPAKIKNHHFESSGRNAYKADRVDSFIEEVSESYEKMFQENGEMFKKLNLLAERLEEYRKDEDNIRNALLAAQRTAEKIVSEAQAKADALVAEVADRTANDNARLDAQIEVKTNEANEQIQAMLADARLEAQKIIDDATRDSKEAAINARSNMIKEEAALDTMKQEVTKMKELLLGKYKEQIELVESLPDYYYELAKKEEEKAAAEAAEKAKAEEEAAAAALEAKRLEEEAKAKEETEAEPEAVEEVAEAESEDEEVVVPVMAETVQDDDDEEPKDIDVSKLQMMISDDDEETEEAEDEEESEEDDSDENVDFVLPELDDESEEYLDKIVDDFKLDDDIVTSNGDIVFTKRTRNDSLEESEAKTRAKVEASEKEFSDADENENEDGGFSVKFDKINSFDEDDEDDDDFLNELDDEDDEEVTEEKNDGSFKNKFKGFFKK